MDIKKFLKKVILSSPIFYEPFFFFSGKKLNRKKLDKQIAKINENWLANRKVCNQVIVSLTTYGVRINDLKCTLYSLISQTLMPFKIVVWLSEEEFNKENLPQSLSIFQSFGVEYCFCKDYKSYKKLIPTIQKYPDYVVVTADDDIYYSNDWLEKLWNCHLEFPNSIVTHTAHEIQFDSIGNILPYAKWKHNVFSNEGILFPTGCGGVLYPPSSLFKDICKEELFSLLAPKADDIWFFFMAYLKGTKIVIVPEPYNSLKYVDIYKEYGLNDVPSLQKENVEKNQNDVQFAKVMDYYQIKINNC